MRYVLQKVGEPVRVVAGGCPTGVDQMARMWATAKGYHFEEYPADWKLGKRAGPLRNTQMIDMSNVIVAFPAATSKGTRDVIKKAQKLTTSKQLFVFELEDCGGEHK